MHPTTNGDARQGPSPLEIALRYASLGWRVVPIWRPRNGVCTCPKGEHCDRPGKHPRTPHGWKDATTDPKRIAQWKWETANIGIATGRESGLLVIDIDPRNGGLDAIKELQERLGKLPSRPTVETGGGGWHAYFRHPPGRVRRTSGAPGIDIKSDGGFVVAPSSVHLSDGVYVWKVKPEDAALPDLPESWLNWLKPVECNTEGAEGAEGPETPEAPRICRKSQEAPAPPPPPTWFADNVKEAIRVAIDKTYARGPGQRHDGIKVFVRRLKAIPEVADRPPDDLLPFLEQWFKMTLPNTKDKDFATTLEDFHFFWEETRYPYGTGIREAFERALATAPPACAVQKYGRASRRTQLAALCRELQRVADDAPFFLGAEKAGEVLEVNSVQAWRWLNRLCDDRIIEQVSIGSLRSRLASTYRYVGG